MRENMAAEISIHALLAESDGEDAFHAPIYTISIHALLAESDGTMTYYGTLFKQFLSTLSLRRATRNLMVIQLPLIFLSTLSLRRATRRMLPRTGHSWDFYPRSPCGERRNCLALTADRQYFYPRSPCGERLLAQANDLDISAISIHALLAESDGWPSFASFQRAAFLSTLSLRRATGRAGRPPARLPDFYPRSPCGERRENADKITRRYQYFYPRSPCGERRKLQDYATTATVFLSTLSLRRATSPSGSRYSQRGYFYPRSPCGERPFLVTT